MSRILIIDDDAAFADLLSALVSREGHEVFTATSAHDALELFRLNFAPHLVLVDLQMERMNGFETIAMLKAHPACAGAVFAMLTAASSDEAANEAKACGAAGFLSKPIQPHLIGRQVARFLDDPQLVWLDDHHTVTRAA